MCVLIPLMCVLIPLMCVIISLYVCPHTSEVRCYFKRIYSNHIALHVSPFLSVLAHLCVSAYLYVAYVALYVSPFLSVLSCLCLRIPLCSIRQHTSAYVSGRSDAVCAVSPHASMHCPHTPICSDVASGHILVHKLTYVLQPLYMCPPPLFSALLATACALRLCCSPRSHRCPI